MRVFIVSPYSGDVEANVEYGKKCLIDSIKRGETPFAGHLFYTQVLDDADSEQRRRGMEMGRDWMESCAFVAVYVDRGMSKGMVSDVHFAMEGKMNITFRRLEVK